MAKKRRIGILAGAFDPVHSGHIHLGQSVLDTGIIDTLLLIPVCSSSRNACGADFSDRWKMLVSACACDERLIPFRPDPDSFCPDSPPSVLRCLKKQYSGDSLYYVLGSDELKSLSSRQQIQDLLSLCPLLVCPADGGEDLKKLKEEAGRLPVQAESMHIVPVEPLPVSSSSVRDAFSSGVMPEGLDPSVLEYCTCKGLYGYPRRLDQIDPWIDRLFDSLKPGRFAHSLSVAFTARRLAEQHGLDSLKAEQAGLLHDCAKCLPLNEMQRIAVDFGLTDDPSILESGALLHSLVGAWIAENRYGMSDPDVLDAIRYHNTGMAGMSRLAMCVCLSDSIEPLRKQYPLLDQIRSLSEVSIERALLLSLERTADYVSARGRYLHPRTQNAIRWLKELPCSI